HVERHDLAAEIGRGHPGGVGRGLPLEVLGQQLRQRRRLGRAGGGSYPGPFAPPPGAGGGVIFCRKGGGPVGGTCAPGAPVLAAPRFGIMASTGRAIILRTTVPARGPSRCGLRGSTPCPSTSTRTNYLGGKPPKLFASLGLRQNAISRRESIEA